MAPSLKGWCPTIGRHPQKSLCSHHDQDLRRRVSILRHVLVCIPIQVEPLLRFLCVSIRLVWEYSGGNFCGFVLKSHASGWDSWIRTNGMSDPKSDALPLGDIPIKIDRHLIFYLQTISQRSLCIQVVGSYPRNTESYHKSQIHSGNPASKRRPI